MKYFKIPAIILAATIGEGVFALPYVFYSAGWVLSLAYMALLVVVVAFAHVVYVKTLKQEGEKRRLLGLVKEYFGSAGFWAGLGVIIIGLLLTIVAYLILGPKFLELAFPWISPQIALAVIWLLVAIPALVTNSRAIELEVAGIMVVAAILLFVFGSALPGVTLTIAPAANLQNAFLPFGIMLLSLAGWTGIEPAYEAGKKEERKILVAGVVLGTVFAATLYILFVAGIFGSAARITPDTLSGITNWPAWKRLLLSALGLFGIATGAVPITHEIRNALEKDLRWHPSIARLVIIFAPLVAVLSGFNQFVIVLSLAGGVFIALQYLLILLVGRKVLKLSLIQKIALNLIAAIFILAAVYEAYSFVVH